LSPSAVCVAREGTKAQGMRIFNRTYVELFLQISGFGHAVLAFDQGGSLVSVLLTIIGLVGRLTSSGPGFLH